MNKNDIIEKVARVTCAKGEAADAVNTLFKSMLQSLKNNEKITISGFGTFSVSSRKARKGRNPKTGKQIYISEKTVVKFKPAKNILSGN